MAEPTSGSQPGAHPATPRCRPISPEPRLARPAEGSAARQRRLTTAGRRPLSPTASSTCATPPATSPASRWPPRNRADPRTGKPVTDGVRQQQDRAGAEASRRICWCGRSKLPLGGGIAGRQRSIAACPNGRNFAALVPAGISTARQRTPYPSTPSGSGGPTPSIGRDPVTPTPAYIDAVRAGGMRSDAAHAATAATTTARTRKAVA